MLNGLAHGSAAAGLKITTYCHSVSDDICPERLERKEGAVKKAE